MKNNVIINIALSFFLISTFAMYAMEEQCTKPISSYTPVMQAYRSFQNIYNNPEGLKEFRATTELASMWPNEASIVNSIMAINDESFMQKNANNALSSLYDTIDDLTDYLEDKQRKTGLPAGGIQDYEQKLFYHFSNMLYQLQQLYYKIQDVCPTK
jgi:hypothetical protein